MMIIDGNPNMNICPVCQSKIVDITNSLHCWMSEYECGCKIYGNYELIEFDFYTKCPKLILPKGF